MGADTGTKASAVDTNYGWAVEAAIPLETFDLKLENGAIIGFNVQLNDDDDKVDRDHKLSWSEVERAGTENSHLNPSVFGELKFIETKLSGSGENKLAVKRGLIKITW
jgi:hypothetical protein